MQLQKRISQTLRKLHKIAEELSEDGYLRAAEFIRKNAGFMVTFAELALEDIKIPYTTNRIERLMGEVSKRCKHKWMHWSTQGLKDILTIVLVRYTNKPLYDKFKKAYIHNENIQ
jgi:transposase-like protein